MTALTTTTLATLRNPAIETAPDVSMGFGSLASFELMQRAAKLLCSSTLVPTQYRAVIEKIDRYGNITDRKENPNALANAVVALNMAQRMGADPLMIMQNLFVIEGRPSWSSQFIVAAINSCGKFSPLRFALRELGEKEVERIETFWENKQRQTRTVKVSVVDRECIAWATERETGERLESPPVTMEMAVKEGWYTKTGSKWQTMPDVMLRYRAASFFGRLYAPELLMGLRTVEEVHDIIDVSPETGEVLSVTTDSLRADMKAIPGETIDVDTGEVLQSEEPAERQQEPPQEAAKEVTKEEKAPAPKPPPKPQQKAKPETPRVGPEAASLAVKSFLAEINKKATSMEVDQWRAKHHNRVANSCGGVESEEFLQVMDYAEVVYRDLLAGEEQARA
jgi:hypothetical protein